MFVVGDKSKVDSLIQEFCMSSYWRPQMLGKAPSDRQCSSPGKRIVRILGEGHGQVMHVISEIQVSEPYDRNLNINLAAILDD